ncbi:YhgE/Pip domain-containing protein [Nocardia sp. NPDC052566]|uniref:YhgE/Pip domain-containing protein n=1 Tax=Nocardia sp. NPDC052566 TaxID=3364330 RepID=UPI0037CA9CCB
MTPTAEDTSEGAPTTRDNTLWAVPLIVAMGLLSLLALSYLGSILDPQRNVHDFPIALVDADRGEYGRMVADEVIASLPADQVRWRVTDRAQAESLMSVGKIYGTVVIPEDFSARLSALSGAAAGDGRAPVVEVRTNPRAGSTATMLTVQLVTPALERVDQRLGVAATDRARANGVPLSDAALVALGRPIDIAVVEYRALPEGTANGISAFYYTLLVVFAGFTGSALVNAGVDAAVQNEPDISRWRVLLYKWELIAVVALVMSGIYQLIATALGMPVNHPVALYCFAAYASLAIGMTAMAVITLVSTVASAIGLPVLNTLSMPINMLVFLALGLPSSGGIVPIEAAPRVYGLLSEFEPMHQVFLGVRSILYFDAQADAGLSRAVVMCTLGTVFAIVVGVVGTIGYERFRARAS